MKEMVGAYFGDIDCEFCGRFYTADIFFGQGYGCASVAHEKGVSCGDGSKHDLTEFCWKKYMPWYGMLYLSNGRTARVCDICIDGWLKQGFVEEV